MRQITRRGWQAEGRVEVSRGGSHHAAAPLLSGTAGRSRTPGAWFWRPAHTHVLGDGVPSLRAVTLCTSVCSDPVPPRDNGVAGTRNPPTISNAQSGELLPGAMPGPDAEVRPSPSPVASGTTFSTDWLGTAVAVSTPSPWSPRAALSAPSRVALSSPKRRQSPQAPAESREETPIEGHARPALAQAPVEPRTAVSGRFCAPTGSPAGRPRSWPRRRAPATGGPTRRAPRIAISRAPWPGPRGGTPAAPPAPEAQPTGTRRYAGAREAAPWA